MRVRFKSKRVYILSIFLGIGVYFLLWAHAWSIDAGACVGYSALVLGLARSRRNGHPIGKRPRPHSSALLGHLGFLAIVVAFIRFVLFAKPFLPWWLLAGDERHPNFGLVCLSVFCLLCIQDWEQRWLAADRRQESVSPDAIEPEPKSIR
jgi:hypothetical protein